MATDRPQINIRITKDKEALHKEAMKLRGRMGLSISDLYWAALQEYVKKHKAKKR